MPKRRPHICFVAPRAFPILIGDQETQFVGGAELQQVIVAKGLSRRGFRISMICLDFGQQDMVEIDGVTVIRAYRPDQGFPMIRFIWPRLIGMWKCLRRANADIYYQRAASILTGMIAVYCSRYDRKSVFAAAGNPNFEKDTSRIQYQRDRWIYEYGLRNVDLIVAQNSEQANLCQRNFGRDSVIVPNCYTPPPPKTLKGRGHVLWVSTFRNLKRPELFIELAASLPMHRFRMVGGPGPGTDNARLFKKMKVRAEKIENLEFRGFVPYSRIDEHFDDAALLVNTSDSEGFPNTFLQAWARGIPTISFVDCGARVNGRPVGQIVRNTEDLVHEVADLLSDDTRRSYEGAICLEYVNENHSLERVLDTYEQVFCGLVTQ